MENYFESLPKELLIFIINIIAIILFDILGPLHFCNKFKDTKHPLFSKTFINSMIQKLGYSRL